MKPLRRLLERMAMAERRRAGRKYAPSLVAYYWDGSNPISHRVQNISESGFFLDTKERWYPGTLVMMTLQRTDGGKLGESISVAVQSRVVRAGENGVGFAFVPPSTPAASGSSGLTTHAADRKTLNRFLKAILPGDGK